MKILDNPRSGSYAGVTSSRNRYGQYVRTRASPVNPGTSYQATVRGRLQTVAAAWRSLTAVQRTGWADLGPQIQRSDSLGTSYDMTGFGAYCLVNLNRLAAGDAVLTDAPLYLPPADLTTITLTVTTSTMSLAYTPTPLGAGERMFTFVSPMVSAGRFYNGNFRLLAVTAAAAASPANIFSAYQTRFGTPVTGSRIFVSAQRYSNGFVSAPLVTSVVVP